MIRKTYLAVVAATLAAGMGVAIAADNPIESRQEMMKNVGASIGVIAKMAKGEMDFDATQANLAMRAINNAALGYTFLFPAGSETGMETEASPKIWENMAGFVEKAKALEGVTAKAIATPATNLDELKAQLGMLGGTCKACHDEFRVKKS